MSAPVVPPSPPTRRLLARLGTLIGGWQLAAAALLLGRRAVDAAGRAIHQRDVALERVASLESEAAGLRAELAFALSTARRGAEAAVPSTPRPGPPSTRSARLTNTTGDHDELL